MPSFAPKCLNSYRFANRLLVCQFDTFALRVFLNTFFLLARRFITDLELIFDVDRFFFRSHTPSSNFTLTETSLYLDGIQVKLKLKRALLSGCLRAIKMYPLSNSLCHFQVVCARRYYVAGNGRRFFGPWANSSLKRKRGKC